MKSRFAQMSVAIFVLLFVGFATPAQTVVTTTQNTATATPSPSPAAPAATPLPEQKAYDDARRIKDPQKKIDALDALPQVFGRNLRLTHCRRAAFVASVGDR